jgi:LPS-assembly protein
LLVGDLQFGTCAGQTAATPNRRVKIVRPNAPPPDQVLVRAIRKEVEGKVYHLRGASEVETSEALLTADEIDYDEGTGKAEARGNVVYRSFNGGEVLKCSRAEYDVNSETGKFYDVSGTIPATIEARPGILTSENPFYFEGKVATRVEARYRLHDGFVTSCKVPKPWWILRGPLFDIVPGERAITRNSVFLLRGIPLFYTPFFYKSLEKAPRRSGFLMPNIGNSTRRGLMLGAGYYWAINRSYDLTYRAQYFSQRGFAHLADFRGKPTRGSDFNLLVYGVNDRGRLLDNGTRGQKEGGYTVNFTGRAQLPKGWTAFAQINYLSSFRFRQAFTETFNEAVSSEVHSTAYLTKHWNGYGLTALFDRAENFQSLIETDKISIRKLPQIEFVSQERRIWEKVPVWLSFESSAGLLRRNQQLYQTRQAMERLDLAPRVSAALKWKHISLVPYLAPRGTYWGSTLRRDTNGISVTGEGLVRSAFETGADLVLPSMARIYKARGWFGEKLKHVIEPRASYRYVTGVSDFRSTIRFDETELLTNTNEVEISLTNRFYSKKGNVTREWLSWQVWQRRYFDPTFGGAVVPGQRNVFESTASLTSFNFLGGPRSYSPIVSALRMEPTPGLGIEWRADYDPLRGRITNSGVTADGRLDNVFLSFGHTQVRTDTFLSPPTNQIRGLVGFGRENRRGWNTAFFAIYDYRAKALLFGNTQITYNTDCCGFSVQYQRFGFQRNDNIYRFALSIANIGSFGTLRRQERYF